MSVDGSGDGAVHPSGERPITIVGAGISGLAVAVRLHRAGLPVRVFEGSNRVGGRVGTDEHEGFLLDRGFQVLLDSYSELNGILDLTALRLRAFEPGCMIRRLGVFYPLFDPVRRPTAITRMMGRKLGSWSDWLKIVGLRARWARRTTVQPDEFPGLSVRDLLEREGFSEEIIDQFFTPFFSGVFLEYELKTAACFFPFIFSRFSAGSATLPEGGMQAIPDQLAAALPQNSVVLNRRVAELQPHGIVDEEGNWLEASLVIDARSLGASEEAAAHSASVYYFETPAPLPESRTLYVGTGEDSLIHIIAPLSGVQPSYAPRGRHLIAVTCYPTGRGNEHLRRELGEEVASWFGFRQELVTYLAEREIPRALGRFVSHDDIVPKQLKGIYRVGDVTEYPSLDGALRSARLVAEEIIQRTV